MVERYPPLRNLQRVGAHSLEASKSSPEHSGAKYIKQRVEDLWKGRSFCVYLFI